MRPEFKPRNRRSSAQALFMMRNGLDDGKEYAVIWMSSNGGRICDIEEETNVRMRFG